jgi:hypothetical protein
MLVRRVVRLADLLDPNGFGVHWCCFGSFDIQGSSLTMVAALMCASSFSFNMITFFIYLLPQVLQR